MKKTVLVTGGAGYIGSHTVYMLMQEGYQVIVLDNFVYNQPFDIPGVILVRADLADAALLDQLFASYGIDCVMHFAAYIEVGQSVIDPERYYHNNVVNTLQLLACMRKHHVDYFIFSSSCAVYGVPRELPMSEEHVFAPLSPYGKNKLIIEYALQDYALAYGLKYVALRYFNAAGALIEQGLGEWHVPETHLIPNIMRAALQDTSITVFGDDYDTVDGSCIRDYVHVLDIAQAHVRAYQYLLSDQQSTVFNVGTGSGFSVLQVIKAAEAVIGKKLQVIRVARRAGDAPVLVADNRKIKRILEWQPEYTQLETLCSSAFLWEKRRLNYE